MQLLSSVPFSGDELLSPLQKKRRLIDTSRREARAILSPYLVGLQGWHDEAALLLARTARPTTPEGRNEILHRVDVLQVRVADVRQGLIEDLADQPPRVAGHSCVTDIENALDSLAAKLHAIRSAMPAPSGRMA